MEQSHEGAYATDKTMTTFVEQPVTCAVCGETSIHPMLTSTSTFGSPDLDLRPAELQRSTMWMWVRRCPSCGYCAASLDEGPAQLNDVVESDAYREQLGDGSVSELSASFLCQALLLEHTGRLADSAWAMVHAAWACDDNDRGDRAREIRLQAVEHFRRARAEGQEALEGEDVERLLLADLLRRARHFDEAVGVSEPARAASDPFLKAVAAFLVRLCMARDDSVHTLDEVRTPA